MSITGSPMPPFRSVPLLCVVLLTVVLTYLPGLHGSFIFDDYPNIVDNTALHLTEPSVASWLEAAWASPSSDLQRPLASWSFALNHYWTGLDPLPMKATNLVIHLLNGVLLYTLLVRVLRLCVVRGKGVEIPRRNNWLPLLVSAAWLSHPINLTSVLYVVQRMESLAQVFVLTGLLFYVSARSRYALGQSGAGWRLWLGAPSCLVLGVAAKESAVLLPVYALLLELIVLRNLPRSVPRLSGFFLVILVLPGVAGLAWLLPQLFSDGAYVSHAFTLSQRLMTEPRVVSDYAIWILLPLPAYFGLFHDNFSLSVGWLEPWTTLVAVVALLVITWAAWGLRRKRPLATLGWAWFLAAHLLTATIIPLELVFEHRNYFASIGLLMAVADLLLPMSSQESMRFARYVGCFALLVLATVTTGLRASTWGDPIKLAVSEAARNPGSARATYNLGRTLVVLSGYQPHSPLVPAAIEALENAARVPNANILPEVGLIMLASRTGRPIEAGWWQSMHDKLVQRPPTLGDDAAIQSLTECQREGRCIIDDQQTLRVYLAGLAWPHPRPAFLYSYAIFAFNRLHDPALALELARDAAQSHDPQYQLNLVKFFIDLGDLDSAAHELENLKGRLKPGQLSNEVASAEAQLRL